MADEETGQLVSRRTILTTGAAAVGGALLLKKGLDAQIKPVPEANIWANNPDIKPIEGETFIGGVLNDAPHTESTLLNPQMIASGRVQVLVTEAGNPSSELANLSEKELLETAAGMITTGRGEERIFPKDVLEELGYRQGGVAVLTADGIPNEYIGKSVKRQVLLPMVTFLYTLGQRAFRELTHDENPVTSKLLQISGSPWAQWANKIAKVWGFSPAIGLTSEIASQWTQGQSRRILQGVARTIGSLHPEDYTLRFKEAVDLMRVHAVTKDPRVRNYLKIPNGEKAKTLLRVGPVHDPASLSELSATDLSQLMAFFPEEFLRDTITYHGGLKQFCTVYAVPVRETLTGFIMPKFTVFSEDLYRVLRHLEPPAE